MKKQGITVVLCDFACRPSSTIDTEKIGEKLSQNKLVGRVVRLSSPCQASTEAVEEIKGRVRGGKVLVAGCPLLDSPSDGEGFSRRLAAELSLNPGDLLAVDVKSALADLYGPSGHAERSVLRELSAQIAVLAGKEAVTEEPAGVNERTLVYGSGVSGLLAALELARNGIPVDMVETPDLVCSPGCLSQLSEEPALVSRVREQVLSHPGVVPIAEAEAARVQPRQAEFATGNGAAENGSTGNGKPRSYGSIVFAPERVEQPAPFEGALNLTALYRRLHAGTRAVGRYVFLADWTSPTSAEVFRDILQAALTLQKTRAALAWVLLRNVQVCISGQEELYDRCREAGVLFVKYSGGLSVASDYGDFTLAGVDAQTGLPFRIDTPEAVVVPGAATLSGSALSFAASLKMRLYGRSYSQPDSLWRLPNESNIPGVFTVGAARGNMELEGIRADASSAAMGVLQRLGGVRVKESIPVVDGEKCVYCLTCVRLCPFGAMIKNPEEGIAAVNPWACQSCGVCVGACPAGALEMRNLEAGTLHDSFHILSGQEAG